MSIAAVGHCGYVAILDDGVAECGRMGKRITVEEPITGHLHRIYRCRDHSDWIESDKLNKEGVSK